MCGEDLQRPRLVRARCLPRSGDRRRAKGSRCREARRAKARRGSRGTRKVSEALGQDGSHLLFVCAIRAECPAGTAYTGYEEAILEKRSDESESERTKGSKLEIQAAARRPVPSPQGGRTTLQSMWQKQGGATKPRFTPPPLFLAFPRLSHSGTNSRATLARGTRGARPPHLPGLPPVVAG